MPVKPRPIDILTPVLQELGFAPHDPQNEFSPMYRVMNFGFGVELQIERPDCTAVLVRSVNNQDMKEMFCYIREIDTEEQLRKLVSALFD